MTRCLNEKTLFLLREGEGNGEQRLHLKTCELCGERYRRFASDVEFIASRLRGDPPLDEAIGQRIPLVYRAMPVLAALLLAVVLVWGESRFLRSNFPASSEQLASDDLSELVDQVSEALFPAAATGQTEITPAASDLVSVQNALGESCSSGCRELFAGLAMEPTASVSTSGNRRQASAHAVARPVE